MRAVRTVILIWLLCGLAMWIRDGREFCVLETLPFVERPDSLAREYEWFALLAILIGLWGYLMLPPTKADDQRQQNGRRFRSGIVLVPATIIALALISQRLTPAVSFADAFVHSGRLLEHRYFAALCVVVVAVLLLIKRFRNL